PSGARGAGPASDPPRSSPPVRGFRGPAGITLTATISPRVVPPERERSGRIGAARARRGGRKLTLGPGEAPVAATAPFYAEGASGEALQGLVQLCRGHSV